MLKGEVSGAMGVDDEGLEENAGADEQIEDREDVLDEPEEAEEPIRRRVDPLPSLEEQRRHRITHLPYRSWCPQCVAAAANDDPHRRAARPADVALDVPEVHWDYCFPRDESDWNVVLVGRDKETKMTVAHVVPC